MITDFVQQHPLHLHVVVDDDNSNAMTAPKVLGDMFESLAGAVFLDTGCSLERMWCVFYELMKCAIDECCATTQVSCVRRLFEKYGDSAVTFMKEQQDEQTGNWSVTVTAPHGCKQTAVGRNCRIAKEAAAERALHYIESLKL
jgi:endoribonuclease Dicer